VTLGRLLEGRQPSPSTRQAPRSRRSVERATSTAHPPTSRSSRASAHAGRRSPTAPVDPAHSGSTTRRRSSLASLHAIRRANQRHQPDQRHQHLQAHGRLAGSGARSVASSGIPIEPTGPSQTHTSAPPPSDAPTRSPTADRAADETDALRPASHRPRLHRAHFAHAFDEIWSARGMGTSRSWSTITLTAWSGRTPAGTARQS
jgi:hypothetical protein